MSLWTSDAAHLSLPLVACFRWLRGGLAPIASAHRATGLSNAYAG